MSTLWKHVLALVLDELVKVFVCSLLFRRFVLPLTLACKPCVLPGRTHQGMDFHYHFNCICACAAPDRAVWATLLVPVLVLLFGWAKELLPEKHFSVGWGLCSGCWHSGGGRKTWHRENRTTIFTSNLIWLQFHNQCNPVINDVYIDYMRCSCTFHRDFCAALFNYTNVFVSFGLQISRWFLI